MARSLAVLILAALLAPAPVSADTGTNQSGSGSRTSSTGKRVAWTVIGAAAGFGAGLFIGLNQFDDAIDSDRKVWTSAIVGAAGGGVAGALLSRNIGRSPAPSARSPMPRRREPLNISWAEAVGRSAPTRR